MRNLEDLQEEKKNNLKDLQRKITWNLRCKRAVRIYKPIWEAIQKHPYNIDHINVGLGVFKDIRANLEVDQTNCSSSELYWNGLHVMCTFIGIDEIEFADYGTTPIFDIKEYEKLIEWCEDAYIKDYWERMSSYNPLDMSISEKGIYASAIEVPQILSPCPNVTWNCFMKSYNIENDPFVNLITIIKEQNKVKKDWSKECEKAKEAYENQLQEIKDIESIRDSFRIQFKLEKKRYEDHIAQIEKNQYPNIIVTDTDGHDVWASIAYNGDGGVSVIVEK